MRHNRKPDETWAIGQMIAYLERTEPGWVEDPTITDKPDLVLDGPGGCRVACELSTVGIQEWHRWQNDRGVQLDVDQLDSWVLPREPDIWLKEAIANKSPKAKEYMANSGAAEAWLLVHSSQSKPHDFFVLEEDYDLPLLQGAGKDNSHPFTRIYGVPGTVY